MNSAQFKNREDKSREEIELGEELLPKFNKKGLIPCITVDADSGEVLMFAWMNREAMQKTLESGKATLLQPEPPKTMGKRRELRINPTCSTGTC